MAEKTRDPFGERFAHWDKHYPKKSLVSITSNGKPKRYFEANGTKYVVLVGEEAMTIHRWSAYEKLQTMLGFNASIQSLYDQILKIEEGLTSVMQGKAVLLEVIKRISQLKDGITVDIQGRFSKALYICTLFITRENEDLSKWSMKDAESKIEDWAEAGISVGDFLTLAPRYCSRFAELWIKNTVSGLEQNKDI